MYKKADHIENLNDFNFLVTGGAGFIGSNIVDYLLKHNAKKVRVLDNFSTGSKVNIKIYLSNNAFELIEGDIRDLETCRKALVGMDFVLHQAAVGSVARSIDDPINTNEINVNGFLNMMLSARDTQVKRFVYAASSSTYGDHPDLPKTEDKIGNPLSPYAITKYVNELYAAVFSKIYDFHAIGLRYFNVFGPRQNPEGPYAAVIPAFINAALQNKAALINGDGEQSRDFTFVENVVEANISALFVRNIHDHQVFNIACGEQTTINQLWKKINAIAGSDLQVTHLPAQKGDVRNSWASIEKAGNLLDYHPQVSLQQGLERTYKWYFNKLTHLDASFKD